MRIKIIIFLGLFTQGCTFFDGSAFKYYIHKSKWEKLQINNYSFVIQSGGQPEPSMRKKEIFIENGKIKKAIFLEDAPLEGEKDNNGNQKFLYRAGEEIKEDGQVNLYTIDELFIKISEAIYSNAVSVQVTYNEEYGYPTNIYIDESIFWIDEEQYIFVEGFKK